MKRLPIKAAKDIGKKYGYTRIVVLAIDDNEDVASVVTWGRNLIECESAALYGNEIKKKLLNWPEEECKAMPKRVKVRQLVD